MQEVRKRDLIISISLKSLVVLCVIIGIIFTFIQSEIERSQQLLYYTVQSNIWVGIIFAVFLIYEIISYRKGGENIIPNWLLITKFAVTVAITLTCIVYNFVLYPSSLHTDDPTNPLRVCSLFTHIIVPILAIYDYFKYDHKMKIKKTTFLWGLSTPLYYLPFAIICANLGANFGDGQKFPYFFLDYELNTWFELGGGKIGVFYWIIMLAIVVALISIVLLWLLNIRHKRYIKRNNMIKD